MTLGNHCLCVCIVFFHVSLYFRLTSSLRFIVPFFHLTFAFISALLERRAEKGVGKGEEGRESTIPGVTASVLCVAAAGNRVHLRPVGNGHERLVCRGCFC